MNHVFDAPSFTDGSKTPNPKTPFDPISSSFDKPVYDDDEGQGGGGDILDGVFGLKKNSSSGVSTKNGFDEFDLFGDLEVEGKSKNTSTSRKIWGDVDADFSAFDDLMPGFRPSKNRETTGTGQPQQSSVPSTISTSSVIKEPFVTSQTDSYPPYASSVVFTEPLEEIYAPDHYKSRVVDVSPVELEIADDIAATPKSFFPSDLSNKENDEIRLGTNPYRTHNFVSNEPIGKSSIKISKKVSEQKISSSNFQEFHQSLFEMPAVSSVSNHAFTQNGCHTNTNHTETGSHMGRLSNSEDDSEASDDVWLTVTDITLTTLPTRAPPPSRPPPRPQHTKKSGKGYPTQPKDSDVFSSFYHSGQSNWSSQTVHDAVKNSNVSLIDELEDFARDKPQRVANEHSDVLSDEVAENSAAEASAAAMKVAMDRAEAKFKQAREVWERKNAAKNGGAQKERDEKIMQDIQKREEKESLECGKEQRESDEKDREERKMEKERIEAQEIEKKRERAEAQEIEKKREREKARQAVDRAMKEARERAAVEARQKAERAAVDRVNAGARERAERAAVQRAQAEARERAAAVAREKAAKADAEAMERKIAEDIEKAAAVARAEAEIRTRTNRAFVNRATAEARERAASAATRRNQQKSESDFNPFFNASAHSDNVSRSSSSDSASDAQLHNRHVPEKSVQSTSSGTRNVVDDLTSFFGATPQSGDFQEVVGESDERRRSRLERDQRMQERSEKALADKHERDRHTQWEQAERQRMSESLDFEIKRWASGKEGNLRLLLSTLQYVLWPECGWQPVSISDLITSVSVKKVYRKATLCIHPDKVQQKGANLQQKYIAEKVFDLLKEAWNKLNSEELF